MREKLDQFNSLTERRKLFAAELHRRRLTIPSNFKLCCDNSPLSNVNALKRIRSMFEPL